MFKTGPIFEVLRNCVADICILQGGTDSGKTHTAIQYLFFVACFTKAPETDPIITVLNESVPNSKKGAYRTAKGIYDNNPELQLYVKEWREGDRIVIFKSGWIMEFLGATDEQNAKQGKRQYLFVNEANGISWLIFWQMAKRTRIRTIIDYNPSAPFWAHEKLIGTHPESNDLGATVQLNISDHRHNPFLSEQDHRKTEGIQDAELFKVYARGLTGNLTGIIFPTWKEIRDVDFPWQEPMFAGQDFGYTNDPSAGIRMARIANKIFLHELCYTPGLTPRQLGSLYSANGFKEDHPIYCEHDTEIIRALRQLDFLALPARKGPNSIKAGILKVNEYEVYFTASSKNINMERKKYMWVKNPDTGKPTNAPTEVDNHLMDATRYGVYTHYFRQE
jgi:phage terminase large subunit